MFLQLRRGLELICGIVPWFKFLQRMNSLDLLTLLILLLKFFLQFSKYHHPFIVWCFIWLSITFAWLFGILLYLFFNNAYLFLNIFIIITQQTRELIKLFLQLFNICKILKRTSVLRIKKNIFQIEKFGMHRVEYWKRLLRVAFLFSNRTFFFLGISWNYPVVCSFSTSITSFLLGSEELFGSCIILFPFLSHFSFVI